MWWARRAAAALLVHVTASTSPRYSRFTLEKYCIQAHLGGARLLMRV
ncbi:hypothetical protein SAMN05421665_1397 [Yoonia rosea]|uniref:Uncharacterized protein n=1 Tax=Yoonia rosea TaxID=287098 RepID=A0A1R3WVJ9_9RHOB|nr:hypothetical protein SAMN05421665_1397 [Yoonia rosea]